MVEDEVRAGREGPAHRERHEHRAEERAPARDDVRGLQQAVAAATGEWRLRWDDAGWRWDRSPGDPLRVPLRRVLDDAVDLLTGAEAARLGVCAAHHCGWLFTDTSKNGTRRWCSMKTCGNRAKAQRHYRRHAE